MKDFSIENQYKTYLERVNMKEESMHPVQRVELKRAFFGAVGQLLLLMRDEISELPEDESLKVLELPHTCGLEPMSIKTKLFYAIEDPESPESDEPTIHHKWGKWKKEPIPKILRGAVTGLAVRKCSVCGANQHRTYYRGQKYPSLDIERNGRSDVDCNPELKPQSKT